VISSQSSEPEDEKATPAVSHNTATDTRNVNVEPHGLTPLPFAFFLTGASLSLSSCFSLHEDLGFDVLSEVICIGEATKAGTVGDNGDSHLLRCDVPTING